MFLSWGVGELFGVLVLIKENPKLFFKTNFSDDGPTVDFLPGPRGGPVPRHGDGDGGDKPSDDNRDNGETEDGDDGNNDDDDDDGGDDSNHNNDDNGRNHHNNNKNDNSGQFWRPRLNVSLNVTQIPRGDGSGNEYSVVVTVSLSFVGLSIAVVIFICRNRILYRLGRLRRSYSPNSSRSSDDPESPRRILNSPDNLLFSRGATNRSMINRRSPGPVSTEGIRMFNYPPVIAEASSSSVLSGAESEVETEIDQSSLVTSTVRSSSRVKRGKKSR